MYLPLHNLRYYSMQVFWSEGFLRKCVVMDLVISTTCEFLLTNAVQWRGTQTLSDPNLFVLPEVTRARIACYSTTTQLPRLFWIVRASLVCDGLVLSCLRWLLTDPFQKSPSSSQFETSVMYSNPESHHYNFTLQSFVFFPSESDHHRTMFHCLFVCAWRKATAGAKQTAVSLRPRFSSSLVLVLPASLESTRTYVFKPLHARVTQTQIKSPNPNSMTGSDRMRNSFKTLIWTP